MAFRFILFSLFVSIAAHLSSPVESNLIISSITRQDFGVGTRNLEKPKTSTFARMASVWASTLYPTRHFPSNYSNSIRANNTFISPHYNEKKSTKHWNDFYKRHQNKFFKDRHYLEKDWTHYFSSDSSKFVLEVGCGAGNTIFPLIKAYPNIFIHACDFSANAISLVKSHEDFEEDRVNAFVCDITNDDLSQWVEPTSVDVVTLIFALSAVSPKKMPLVLQNLKKVIKPGGHVLFRDYAVGDFAQEKLISKNQMISENFCVRGDGTCAFYFSEDFLSSLFQEEGFNTMEMNIYCKEIVNRSRNIVMDRRWARAIFCYRSL